MSAQAIEQPKIVTKEDSNEEIDLFDIIRFLIRNRVTILSCACLGLLAGLAYALYSYKRIEETAKITIPVSAEFFNKDSYKNNLNLNYFNRLVDNYNKRLSEDGIQTAQNALDWVYYFNKKLYFTTTEDKTTSVGKNPQVQNIPIKLQSFQFFPVPTGYAFITETTIKNLNTEALLNAINFASSQLNQILARTLENKNTENIDIKKYVASYKNKLSLDLFKTRLRLKEMGSFKPTTAGQFIKLNDIIKNVNTSSSINQFLSQMQNFIIIENFKDYLIEKESQHKLTPEQENKDIESVLTLIEKSQDLETKLAEFPDDKFLPLFKAAGDPKIEIFSTERQGVKKFGIILVEGFILGCAFGIFLAIGRLIHKEFKLKIKETK